MGLSKMLRQNCIFVLKKIRNMEGATAYQRRKYATICWHRRKYQPFTWMTVWLSDCMNVRCMNVLTYECTDVWMYWRMNVLTYECTDVWTYWRMNALTYECADVWTYWCMNVLTYLRIDVWTYGCTNVWTDCTHTEKILIFHIYVK